MNEENVFVLQIAFLLGLVKTKLLVTDNWKLTGWEIGYTYRFFIV